MSWRDSARPASFRGVPFYTDANERAGGRQVVAHDFPFSENPNFIEDLGKKGRKFNVEGYVLGVDYETARDRLIAALEVPGPGELNHAQFGVVRVAVASYRTRETRTEGGIASFSIEFLETTAAASNPTAAVNTASALTAAATAAKNALSLTFLSQYVSLPTLFVNSAAAVAQVSRALGQVLDLKTLAGQQVAALAKTLADLESSAVELSRAPSDLVAAVASVFASLADALTGSPAPSRAFLALYGLELTTSFPSSAEAANLAALSAVVDRLALTYACEALALESFDSYEQAISEREQVLEALDAHTEAVTDDAFPALLALRAATVAAVPGAGDLPHLQSYTPNVSLPSLVLAHRLYGDVDGEADLLARNRVVNPVLVPGGVTLEVLSRG